MRAGLILGACVVKQLKRSDTLMPDLMPELILANERRRDPVGPYRRTYGVLAAESSCTERKIPWLTINLRALGPTFGQVGSATRC